jgi:hypothetical protein
VEDDGLVDEVDEPPQAASGMQSVAASRPATSTCFFMLGSFPSGRDHPGHPAHRYSVRLARESLQIDEASNEGNRTNLSNFWRVLHPETADGRAKRWCERRRAVFLGNYALLAASFLAGLAPFAAASAPAAPAVPLSPSFTGLGCSPARSRAVASMRQASQPRGLG